MKEYQGNFDIAYVHRWGPNADLSHIKNWATGCGWGIDEGEAGEVLIYRGHTSRVSATLHRNRICSQCHLENPHNPGSSVCVDCE